MTEQTPEEYETLPPHSPTVKKQNLALWGSVLVLAGVITGMSIATVIAYDPLYNASQTTNYNNPEDHAELIAIVRKSQAYEQSNGMTETTTRSYSDANGTSGGNFSTKEYYSPSLATAATCNNDCPSESIQKIPTDNANLWLKLNEFEATHNQYSINQVNATTYEVIYYDKTANTESETWAIDSNGLVKGIQGHNDTDGIDETWVISLSYDVNDKGDAILDSVN